MKGKFNPYWLYMHHTNIDSLLKLISSSRLPKDFQVKFLFLISKKNPIEVIKEWYPKKFSISIIEEHQNMVTVRLTRKIKKDVSISGIFSLFRYGNSDVYVAVTHEKRDFVIRVLMGLFESSYSKSSRLFLTSNQIQSILDSIKEKLECQIVTEKVVSYSRIDKRKSTENFPSYKKYKSRESDLRWTSEDYKTSFRRAAENNHWVDKISFYAQKDNKILFSASLSREGLFKCDKNVKNFYPVVSSALLSIGEKNVKIFNNKSRLENNGEIKPLVIEYKNNIFQDVEQNKRLIKIMSEFPKSSYSVYHGNPYLHMSIVDYLDGSSYDLWIVSSDRLIIVPQIRATFNSLSRLSEHIMKRFLEGEMSEMVLEI